MIVLFEENFDYIAFDFHLVFDVVELVGAVKFGFLIFMVDVINSFLYLGWKIFFNLLQELSVGDSLESVVD